MLKGALVFTAWQSSPTRPTRDIDLLGYMENTVEQVVAAVRAICQEPAPDDGLRFDLDSIAGERIVEAAAYAGVRVRTVACQARGTHSRRSCEDVAQTTLSDRWRRLDDIGDRPGETRHWALHLTVPLFYDRVVASEPNDSRIL